MLTYKAFVKYQNEYKIIEQESKSKSEFIKNLRANGFKVTDYKVKEKSIFDRAMELLDYVSSKEEGETIWRNIKYVDDSIASIFNRLLGF